MCAAADLVVLAETELRLVLEERFDELDELHARRVGVLAMLPRDADRELLARAATLQGLVTDALTERLDRVRAQLTAADARRTAAAGYARATAVATG